MAFLIIIPIVLFFLGFGIIICEDYYNKPIGIIPILGAILLHAVVPWNTEVSYHPAKVTEIESQLVVSAPGIPIQTVSDIKFSKAPVQLKSVQTFNIWGGRIYNGVEVELAPQIETTK